MSLPVSSEAGGCKIVPTEKLHLLSVQVLLLPSVCACVSFLLIQVYGIGPQRIVRKAKACSKVLSQPNWRSSEHVHNGTNSRFSRKNPMSLVGSNLGLPKYMSDARKPHTRGHGHI